MLKNLARLRRIEQAREASIVIEKRCPDPGDRAALADPAGLAAHLDKDRYKLRAHLTIIGQQMSRLRSGEFGRLSINLPPQCGKTRTAVEWGVFWWLCLQPAAHVVIGSYNERLAVKRGKAVRRLIGQYGPRFGLYIEPGSANMTDWSLTTGGGVRSVGVGGGITGDPADLIVIDDPVRSRKDADSLTVRESVRDWYSADLFSRRSPGCPVLLVCTPWHPDDLRATLIAAEGKVEEGGRWQVVVMPALCTDPLNDPLGRQAGDPLPHPKIAPDKITEMLTHWHEARAGVDARDWSALWQCDPRPAEGTLVSWDLLRERRCYQHGNAAGPCSTPVRIGVSIDPSGGGRDTAGIIGGYLGEDGRCAFTHDLSGVMSSDEWARRACTLAADISADVFVIEKNYGGDMALLTLRTAWQALRREQPNKFGPLVPRIVAVTAKRGKMLRAEPIAQQWVEGTAVTAAYLPELESEWATYLPGADSPGRIDASVYLAYELLPIPASGEPSMAGAALLAETDLLNWGGR